MSRALEKSFGELFNYVFNPSSPSLNIFGENVSVSKVSWLSHGLTDFVEKLETARKASRQDEGNVVQKTYEEWIKSGTEQTMKDGAIAGNLCRSLIGCSRGHYTDMLIYAIKLTQCDKIFHKRIGYLYLSRTMDPGSDMAVLLVNTIQRDLGSPNVIQTSLGLNLFPLIKTLDASSLLKSVVKCLNHQQPYIRKKTVVMTQLFAQSSEFYEPLVPHLVQSIADSDPGVAVAAIVSLSSYLENELGEESCELLDEVSRGAAGILLQATGGDLPPHYNVGSVNCPYIQVQILRAIRNLSHSRWTPPHEVFESIETVLSQPWGGQNPILYATLFEAVKTVSCLPRDGTLFAQALKVILGFLKSSLVDFKYLGIKLLNDVFHVLEEDLTEEHLKAVLDCLHNTSSSSLRSKSIRLLSSMANARNYQSICSTLMEFCFEPRTSACRSLIMSRLAIILNRPYVDFGWSVNFMLPLLEKDEGLEEFLLALKSNCERALMKNPEEDTVIETCYQKLFEPLLKSENAQFCKLDTFASIFNLILNIKPEALDKNLHFVEVFIEKCDIESKKDTINNDNSTIIECLFNCGLLISKFYVNVKNVLINFTKTDTETSFLAKEKLLLLLNTELTLKVLKKKQDILKGNYNPDLSLSFYDPLVVATIENGSVPYIPFSVRINPFPKEHLRLAGSVNPFNIKEDLSNLPEGSTMKENLSIHPEGECTSTLSILSSSGGFSISASGMPPPPRLWTTKGREKSDQNLSKTSPKGSSFPSSEAVEIAEEAAEDEEILDQSESRTVKSKRGDKSDLAKTLLESFQLK